MKKILFALSLSAIVFAGCKKQSPMVHPENESQFAYTEKIKSWINSTIANDYKDSIDYSRVYLTKQIASWYVRIGLKNKVMSNDFILIRTDSLGNCSDARFIHLDGVNIGKDDSNKWTFSGQTTISTIDRKSAVHSAITNGYVEAYHPLMFSANKKESSHPATGDDLPEVVVVAYVPSSSVDGGISYAGYYALEGLLSSGGGSSDAGSYSPSNPGQNDNSTPADYALKTGFEESYFRPAIDITAWMKCFTDMPDLGSVASITLFGDLPDESDPGVGFNMFTGNTGHCFLQLTKTNGSQSVKQIIGFTAQSAGQAILYPYEFIPSKMVNNADHKYNCSITMNLTAAEMNTVISQIKTSSQKLYSIVNYDCLDFGLEVINSVRPANPLLINKDANPDNPFADIATGPKLYLLLQHMLANRSPESPNISVSGSNYAGVSHGPCN